MLQHYRPYRVIARLSVSVPALRSPAILWAVALSISFATVPVSTRLSIDTAEAQQSQQLPAAMSNEELSRVAMQALEKEDWPTAVADYKTLAERGDAGGQSVMGYFYSKGIVVPKDDRQSVFWYRKAAEQGNVKAQAKLGMAYFEGVGGLSVDYARALDLLNKSAAENDPDGEVALGRMYENGKGVPVDLPKALDLYHKAAEQNNAFAQMRLGMMNFDGKGVRQDYSTAAAWLRKAGDGGILEGYIMLASLYMNGLGVEKDYAEAMRLFKIAADKGDDAGQYGIGLMYANGLGVPANATMARSWFTKAAAQGNAKAKSALAMLQTRKANTSLDTAGKVPPSLEYRCVLEARTPAVAAHKSPQVVEALYVDCLRSNWKRLFGSAPFPADR